MWPDRCLFLGQDRGDITFAVNELCQTMSDPSQHTFSKLKRLVGYLKGERQWIQVFELVNIEFRGDSFLRLRLGYEEIVKRGSRARKTTLLKAYTRKQKIVARHWEHQKRKASRA